MTEYAKLYDSKVLMLESIEKEAPSSAATDTAETAAVSYPRVSKINIANLLNLVKGAAQKYIPGQAVNPLPTAEQYAEQLRSQSQQTTQKPAAIVCENEKSVRAAGRRYPYKRCCNHSLTAV